MWQFDKLQYTNLLAILKNVEEILLRITLLSWKLFIIKNIWKTFQYIINKRKSKARDF